MSNYATLKTAIQGAVYTNGNGEITGAGLQAVLLQIVNTVGDGYVFKGVATAGTSAGTPDENVFYIAPAGTYTNFGSSHTVPVGSIGVFTYNGSWSFQSLSVESIITGYLQGKIDLSAAIFDKYVDEQGAIQDYSQVTKKYYYTLPLYVKAGQGIMVAWDDNGMGGISFVSKATGAGDTGPYEPVTGMSRGDSSNTKDAKLFCVRESGYYVISFRETQYNATPIIADYGILKALAKVKASVNTPSDFYFVKSPIICPTYNASGNITSCKVQLSTLHINNNVVGYFGWSNSKNVLLNDKLFEMNVGDLLIVNPINLSIRKEEGKEKLSEGDYIIAELTNTGFIGEQSAMLNDILNGYSYAVRSFLDPSTMVMNKYITKDGNVDTYADYYYTTPIFIEAGTVISVLSFGTGIALISKTDEDATEYEPVVVVNSGISRNRPYVYYVEEAGYYAISGWFTDRVEFINDSLYNSLRNAGSSENNALPSYYNSYLKDRALSVLSVINNAGSWQDSFLFFTDTHILANKMKSPAIIDYMGKRTYMDKVIFGGDFTQTFHNQSEASVNIRKEQSMQLEFANAMNDSKMFMSVHGNHDITDLQNFGISPANVRSMFLQRLTGGGISINEADSYGCYYFYDNNVQKVRYIVFDSNPATNVSPFSTSYGVSKTQMDWIASKAVLEAPNGYNFVFVVHVPVVQNASSDNTWQNYSNVRTLCDAVKNKKTGVTIEGVTYDFSSLSGSLLLVLGGHTHGDLETFVDGVLHVSTAADAFYPNDTKFYSLWGNSNFDRTDGTVTEQLLDAVILCPSLNTIRMERIGAGYSRVFRTDAKVVNVGNAITLTPSISADNWYISDSTGLTYGTISPQAYPIPTNNVAAISNGVVNGLSAGEAIACASDDTNLIREFFYIKVQ